MKKLWLLILAALCVRHSIGQISMSGPVTETFGTSAISSWTNNSTLPGWYLTAGGTFNYAGTITITNAAPSNTGGFYTYICTSGNDIKLGSRPSNASGGAANSGVSYMGMRIRNTTGATLLSLKITYTGYQLSLAENQNNVNTLAFSYQTGATVTSLTTGTWTSVPALTYTAPNNDNSAGSSNQIQGYPCTVSQTLTTCIVVTIANNTEIMLRWGDLNNTANDPHLAIDNIVVEPSPDNACAIVLPVVLSKFQIEEKGDTRKLSWQAESEADIDYYEVEKSEDALNFTGIGKVQAVNSSAGHSYTYADAAAVSERTYYRLKIAESNGRTHYSDIVFADYMHPACFAAYYQGNDIVFITAAQVQQAEIQITDLYGKFVYTLPLEAGQEKGLLNREQLQPGMYLATFKTPQKKQTIKILIP